MYSDLARRAPARVQLRRYPTLGGLRLERSVPVRVRARSGPGPDQKEGPLDGIFFNKKTRR
jgi:hypothetical protein